MKNDNYEERHRKRIRVMKRKKMFRRMTMLIVILGVTVLICMYKCPLFNVSQVYIYGNSRLSSEEIAAQSGISVGENLFRLSTADISEAIEKIPYVDSVAVMRIFIPKPALRIDITESDMAACVKTAEGYIGIDKNAKALELMQTVPEGTIVFTDLSLQGYEFGEKLRCEDEDKLKAIAVVSDRMNKFKFKDKISPISLAESTNISFSYDDRLNIICGSVIDFDIKIDMLETVIQRDDIKDNSRGILDLSTAGTTIYSS